MKKGDEYRGRESGLWLKIRAIDKKVAQITVQRRVVDRSTGEIKFDERQRDVPLEMMPTVLRGYEKV